MIDFEKFTMNKFGTAVLNIVSGLALLCAAAWFSYNVFSSRDLPSTIKVTTQGPATVLIDKAQ